MRGVELSYLKISDGIPLRLWRGVTRVAAPARSVLDRLWSQRSGQGEGRMEGGKEGG